MNLIDSTLTSEGVRFGDVVVPLTREQLAEASSKGINSVVLGVRPENLTLSDHGMPIIVSVVEELGAESFVHGTDEQGDRFIIRAEARTHPTVGATIRASVTDPQHIHVFDKSTGLRLATSGAVPADAPSLLK